MVSAYMYLVLGTYVHESISHSRALRERQSHRLCLCHMNISLLTVGSRTVWIVGWTVLTLRDKYRYTLIILLFT